MGRFFTVFKFHLKENLYSKMFLFSSAMMILLVLGFFGYNYFSNQEKEKDKIAYVNETKQIEWNEKEFNKTNEKFQLLKEKNVEKGKEKVLSGDIEGLFVVKENEKGVAIHYFYNGMPNQNASILFENFIYQKKLAHLIQHEDVDPKIVSSVLNKPTTEFHSIRDNDENIGIVYFFVFLLYTFILMFGQILSNSIVTEKTTRVMEMMIPKVKPIKMMYAKIFAVLTTGILQILIMFAGVLIAKCLGWVNMDNLTLWSFPIDMSKLTIEVCSMFIIYFVLGFVLYALIFAALGSVVNRTEDLQGLLTPFIFLIVGALFIGLKAIFDPTNSFVLIASYIPFFSPIVTFARVVLGEANMVEVMLSIIILVATILIMGLLAGRIYKKGVLKYSSKVSFKDLFSMLKK